MNEQSAQQILTLPSDICGFSKTYTSTHKDVTGPNRRKNELRVCKNVSSCLFQRLSDQKRVTLGGERFRRLFASIWRCAAWLYSVLYASISRVMALGTPRSFPRRHFQALSRRVHRPA